MVSLVVLSPHRDDSVFSLAMSLSHWRTLPVEIVVLNFFTVSAYAPYAVTLEGLPPADISYGRRLEDHHALAMIDPRIRVCSAGLLDAPLRLHTESFSVCDVNRVSVRERDVKEVAAEIEGFVRSCAVIAPLGLGNHVDHLTVRAAAMTTVHPSALAFYEDLPYATCTSEDAIHERRRDTEQRLRSPLAPVIVRSACNIAAKRRISSLYKTQVQLGTASALSKFAAKYQGGERIWIPRHSRLWHRIT